MEKLYKLSRPGLIKLALWLKNQRMQSEWRDNLDLFDPFSDQQIRDYIVNLMVHELIDEWAGI